uniref:Uncharacterized protein n=1 Tax=Tetranychus urticae TaxID=32264 RepID=A0A158P576_TETUR
MRMKFLSKVYTAVYDGFYLSDDKAFFVCFCCGLHIPTTPADLNNVDLHCTFSLNCAYLKNEELGLKFGMMSLLDVYQLFQMRENRTFSFQHSKYTILEANTFVESGFFYCGFGYIFQCAFCVLSFDTKLRSNPSLIHKHLYPGCPFSTASKYENDRNNCVVGLVEPRILSM